VLILLRRLFRPKATSAQILCQLFFGSHEMDTLNSETIRIAGSKKEREWHLARLTATNSEHKHNSCYSRRPLMGRNGLALQRANKAGSSTSSKGLKFKR
jgi:hypothetical protein